MNLPHLPALRRGKPYESLETVEVVNHRTGEPMARVSQVNAGIIRKDLAKIADVRAVLKKFTVEELIGITAKAGELFLNSELPLGDQGHMQSPEEYVRTLSSTSGLPHVMVRRNMQKIHHAMTNMRTVLNGLTRGLPLEVIDKGYGTQSGAAVSYFPTTNALGLIMPSNSPAVNSLWLPAIALKTPVIIKPGREEPWTPYRLIQSFIAAGAPPEAFGFYPTDHEGSGEVMKLCGRALIFGDASTVEQYRNNPKFSIHGPGWSKVLIGDDEIENWREYIDLMAMSIAENGGRSCINASAVVVPKYAAEIAEALAQKLGPVAPTEPDDEAAKLSGFANPKMADFIDSAIEDGLQTPGATDVTAKYRNGSRKVDNGTGVYLRPTIVLCDSFEHPLANKEFLCPYASVVEVPQSEMLKKIGPSLVVSAITKDPQLSEQLLESPLIDRLNLGPVPTMKISWDQPHEGNMFEFLYKRRSIERGW
ncbi:MAG: aldehyde dehydrogenase [Verrucomicrobiaceae bacterium]|nr:MAG: aldehyde dehydrogenase [Verrucomicrobiaceae bacterium]